MENNNNNGTEQKYTAEGQSPVQNGNKNPYFTDGNGSPSQYGAGGQNAGDNKYVFINGQMYVNSNYMNTVSEHRQMKKKYRRLGNSIGLPLSLFFFGTLAFGYFLGRIINIIFFLTGVDISGIFFDPNFEYILNAVLSVVLFTVPFLITSKMTGYKWRDTVLLRSAPLEKSVAVVMLGLGVCVLSNIASAVFGSIFKGITGSDPVSNDIGISEGPLSFIITLLSVGIMPALVEEFAFRGVILGTMRKYMSDGASIFLSAALFGLLHGNLVQIPFAFGVGLILAYATVYTGSLIPGMILHCLNNTMSVIFSFALADTSPMIAGIVSLLYYLVLLLVGICGLIMLLKTDKGAFRLSQANSENSGQKIGFFASSAWMIVFYVICAISIIETQTSV